MSYWVEDTNGYVGDIASNRGMVYLLRKGPKALKGFLTRGGTTDDADLAAIVQACLASHDPEIQAVAKLLKKATTPVMVTDGTESDVDLSAEPTPQPDPHSPVQYQGDRIVAYLDKDFEPADPTHAMIAKVWLKDGTMQILSLRKKAS